MTAVLATRQIGGVYLAFGALTAATAAVTHLARLDPGFPPPTDALPATPRVALDLVVHNAAVALWPLALLLVGWTAIPVARTIADTVIAAQLAAHAALVGAAIGTHPDLWRYLPHLPLEWLALTIPAASWLAARHAPTPNPPATVASSAAATVAALTAAAVLETYAVPL